MRWRQLESFIVVCELGSISRAAERLHVAQPALGLQMRGLEDEMGVQLLERHARGVVPTPAGRRVLEWSRESVQSVRQLKEELQAMGTGITASLALGLTPSLALAFSLPILDAVQRTLPDLGLRLTEAPSFVLQEWVQSGRIDLALVFANTPAGDDAAPGLLTERLCFVTAAAGAVDSRGPIALADVLEQPLAMSPSADALRRCVEEAARQIGTPLKVDYEVQSTGVILKLVRHGVANTILPMAMVADDVRGGRLAARPIEAPELLRRLQWVLAPQAAPSAPLRRLQRLVEAEIRRAADDPLLATAYRFAAASEVPAD